MSASFYDLLKYAKTGIAAPGMTAYDKMRAVAMAGGKVKTLTGVPPLSFRANGKPLTAWSMLGNGQQDGTPAPDAPIIPEFVGERTENLFDNALSAQVSWVVDSRKLRKDLYTNSLIMPCEPETEYALSKILSNRFIVWGLRSYPVEGGTNYTELARGNDQTSLTFTTGSSDIYLLVMVSYNSSTPSISDIANSVMLNTGDTPLPYEPYGWKIHITCGGTTTPVYLGQTQTVRKIKKLVLTGDESWYKSNVSGGSRAYFAMATGDISVENAIKCTHFETKPIYTSNDNIGITIIANQGGIRVRTSDSETKSASDFKSYLATQYSAGTPVTVWYVLANEQTSIVNEPLCKIGDYADTLDSADAGITIPTAKGANTLTVDTDLKPSSMTITYRE